MLTAFRIALIISTICTCKSIEKQELNLFDPVLNANIYVGQINENGNSVTLKPKLLAKDDDRRNSINNQICGYELSVHNHNDLDIEQKNIPFQVDLINSSTNQSAEGRITVKNSFKIDCEIQQQYKFFVRAYDCSEQLRRYSKRVPVVINVDDVNEYSPTFTRDSYLFKLNENGICVSDLCKVEATDDDCSSQSKVCGYEIVTQNVPFSIDQQGYINVTKELAFYNYQFEVIAIDCLDKTKHSEPPVKVYVKIVKSCIPTLSDESSNLHTVTFDHDHILETVHIDVCPDTCLAIEDLIGRLEFDLNGSESGCKMDQCVPLTKEIELIKKDVDYSNAPIDYFITFDNPSQAISIDKSKFNGEFNQDFTIRMWMKHGQSQLLDGSRDKEHIFCKSDNKKKNRHHVALLIQSNSLKLLIRKVSSTNETNYYPSEWIWTLSQINDDQWHFYELYVHYPTSIDLYIDKQLFIVNEENFQIINDHPLENINGTDQTAFTLGACWHPRASHMLQNFNGKLSGLIIEQKEQEERANGCIRECEQFIEIADIIPKTETVEFISNENQSVWILRTDSTESFENLLKHVVYRNRPIPMIPGERKLTLKTSLKCLGDNHTTDLKPFVKRLIIESKPVRIELKGNTNYLIDEQTINSGIYLFQNLSIFTDSIITPIHGTVKQSDIKECSISTQPNLLYDFEQLIIPTEYILSQNVQHLLTQTGLILTGPSSIDTYQYILQQIEYISKSPIKYNERLFSLVCIGVSEQMLTNEVQVQVHVELNAPQPREFSQSHAVLSNKLIVDNNEMKKNAQPIEIPSIGSKIMLESKKITGWPIATIVLACLGFVSILIGFLVLRVRSNNKQRTSGDDHSQMEWDDTELNITVNPLDETKKAVPPVLTDIEHHIDRLDSSSSSTDNESNGYESDEAPEKRIERELEWDDSAVEYGPKKV